MAKKKRRVSVKQEEEYEFVPPEFDEKEFIYEDLYGTKIMVTVFALALVIGILCGILDQTVDSWGNIIAFALLILAAVGLKEFLRLLRFDPDLLETKSMLGNYAMFIFLSLGVWILTINPPFAF